MPRLSLAKKTKIKNLAFATLASSAARKARINPQPEPLGPTIDASEARCLFEFGDDDAGSIPVYMDAAGRSPLLKEVSRIGKVSVDTKSRPWTMASAGLEDNEAEVRRMFASLLNVSDQDVAFTPR
jgi:hypothetical protein